MPQGLLCAQHRTRCFVEPPVCVRNWGAATAEETEVPALGELAAVCNRGDDKRVKRKSQVTHAWRTVQGVSEDSRSAVQGG